MAAENVYPFGQLVRITGTATTLAGAPINLTTPTLKLRKPDGNVITVTSFTSPSTGIIYYDVDCNQAGRWLYREYGVSPNQAAAEGSFVVSPPSVT